MREKITVVCSGNICRSPMAEKLLAEALAKENMSTLLVQSAGISAMEGAPASTLAQECLAPLGLDLSKHRSRQLTQEMLNESWLVLCMTQQHIDVINHRFNPPFPLLSLFRATLEGNKEVDDPYYGSFEAYKASLAQIKEAFPSLVSWIKQEWNKGQVP